MKKSLKLRVLFFLLILCSTNLYSQTQESAKMNEHTDTYAYVSVYGKIFTKKLKVQVDLGDTEEQIAKGRELSELLTDKKSYAAVLNFMVSEGFELADTLILSETTNGSGGTNGIVFILKKKTARE